MATSKRNDFIAICCLFIIYSEFDCFVFRSSCKSQFNFHLSHSRYFLHCMSLYLSTNFDWQDIIGSDHQLLLNNWPIFKTFHCVLASHLHVNNVLHFCKQVFENAFPNAVLNVHEQVKQILEYVTSTICAWQQLLIKMCWNSTGRNFDSNSVTLVCFCGHLS